MAELQKTGIDGRRVFDDFSWHLHYSGIADSDFLILKGYGFRHAHTFDDILDLLNRAGINQLSAVLLYKIGTLKVFNYASGGIQLVAQTVVDDAFSFLGDTNVISENFYNGFFDFGLRWSQNHC